MAGKGFYVGAETLPNLINKICDELLAVSGSSWSEPDGSGDWIIDANTAGHRALKYTNGSEVIYITFEVIKGGNTPWGVTANDGVELGVHNTYYRHSGKGLRFGYAAGWDELNHKPSGSWLQTFIAYYTRYTYQPSNMEEWRATGNLDWTTPSYAQPFIDYWLWIEDNGFALIGNPAHQSQNNRSGAFILICERNPNKEYNDGMPFFYSYARQSCWEVNGKRNDTSLDGLRMECVLRPWSYRASTRKEFKADPNTTFAQYSQEIHQSWDATDLGHIDDPIGIEFPKSAIRSIGNGKVYYVKPIVHNSFSVGANKHETAFDPMFQSDFFLHWRPDTGILHGDILKWESPSTRQYLVLEIGSNWKDTNSDSKLRYAIKYVD
jgi:hypothetical protein